MSARCTKRLGAGQEELLPVEEVLGSDLAGEARLVHGVSASARERRPTAPLRVSEAIVIHNGALLEGVRLAASDGATTVIRTGLRS